MKPEIKTEVTQQPSDLKIENAENSSPNHAKQLAETNKLFQIKTLEEVPKKEASLIQRRKRTLKLSDPLTKEETQDLNFSILELLLDNGIDFSIVDSPSFVNFCKKMRPTFASPTHEHLLNEHLKPLCSGSALSSCVNVYPILYLLIVVNDIQAVHIVTFIRNEEKFLLIDFKLATQDTYVAEIPEVLKGSILKIKEKFKVTMMMCMFNAPATTNFNDFSLGEDDLSIMPDNNIRINTIRTHLISSPLVKKVVLILEYFQQVDFEGIGGLAIPPNLQDLSFQKVFEVFRCYVANIEIMNSQVADQNSQGNGDLSREIIRINSDHFQFLFLKTTVVAYLSFINDLDELEKNFVDKKVSDAVQDWFELQKKYKFDESLHLLVEQVVIDNLGPIELSANVLNWKYRGGFFITEKVPQYFQVLSFLTKILQTKGEGASLEKALKILSQYMGDPDSFKEFFKAQIGVQTFWKIIANQSPILQSTATDLLVLPASMPRISSPRKTLEPEKILAHYVLKFKNSLPCPRNADHK